MPYSHFRFYSKEDILSFTNIRRFETKLGEKIGCSTGRELLEEFLKTTDAKYIIFGIPEDIGIKANLGKGGADTAWEPFVKNFLNIQSNDFLCGDEIIMLGYFDFHDVNKLIETNAATGEEKIAAYRHAVLTIDEEVENLVKMITQFQKIPIIIGGGHNNAYPAIKGASKGLYKAEVIPLAQINCINLDAHSDYRAMEGRHSGNAFHYADEDGYLDKYCVIGLHENYLQQNVWTDMVNSPFIDCITYEDIFVHEKRNFTQAIAHATGFTEDTYTGVELDLDSIENTLSSAQTPCGISTIYARQFMNFVAIDSKVAYVHICEGSCRMEDGTVAPQTGKLISYLVSDFIKSHVDSGK
ncbi:formimidoylglutamase [soil metagenome]